jgi:hypothetical protein
MSERDSYPGVVKQTGLLPFPGSRVNPQQAIRHAAAAYSHGEWAQAEQFCQMPLNAQANYFDALTLAGVIAAQTGRAEEAGSRTPPGSCHGRMRSSAPVPGP